MVGDIAFHVRIWPKVFKILPSEDWNKVNGSQLKIIKAMPWHFLKILRKIMEFYEG